MAVIVISQTSPNITKIDTIFGSIDSLSMISFIPDLYISMELFIDLISSLISPISGFSVKSTVNNGDEKFINLIGVVKKEGPSIVSPPIWNSTMYSFKSYMKI